MKSTKFLFESNFLFSLVLSGCRSVIGLMWLLSLRWKLPPTFVASGDHRSLMEWMQLQVAHPTVGLYADFVANVAIPNFILFAWLTFLIELTIGLSLTVGVFTRWGAILGLIWSFNLAIGLLSVPGEWPWSYLMLIMWHTLFFVSANHQKWGFDGWWQKRKL